MENSFDFLHWTFIDRLGDKEDPRIDVYEHRSGDVIGGLYPVNTFGLDLDELQEFFCDTNNWGGSLITEQQLYDWLEENIEYY